MGGRGDAGGVPFGLRRDGAIRARRNPGLPVFAIPGGVNFISVRSFHRSRDRKLRAEKRSRLKSVTKTSGSRLLRPVLQGGRQQRGTACARHRTDFVDAALPRGAQARFSTNRKASRSLVPARRCRACGAGDGGRRTLKSLSARGVVMKPSSSRIIAASDRSPPCGIHAADACLACERPSSLRQLLVRRRDRQPHAPDRYSVSERSARTRGTENRGIARRLSAPDFHLSSSASRYRRTSGPSSRSSTCSRNCAAAR